MREVLAFGKSEIAEEDIFTSVDEVDIILENLLTSVSVSQCYVLMHFYVLKF